MLTSAAEDYLKVIYKLQDSNRAGTTNAIAERMDVSPAAVTNMMKKLAEMGLVQHIPYQSISLTDTGQKIALEIIRHHRLLEVYLAEAMGYGWDEVDEEAERLEHVISEAFEDRIDALLGYPEFDPHGAPIPRKDGTIEKRDHISLGAVEPGGSVTVRRVRDSEPDLLRYLGQLGLRPDTIVEILSKEPFDGPLHIRIGNVEHHVGRQVANSVWVEALEQP